MKASEAVSQLRSERQAEVKELRDQVAKLVDRVARLEKMTTSSKTTSVPGHSHKEYLGKQHWDALNRQLDQLAENQREVAKQLGMTVEKVQ